MKDLFLYSSVKLRLFSVFTFSSRVGDQLVKLYEFTQADTEITFAAEAKGGSLQDNAESRVLQIVLYSFYAQYLIYSARVFKNSVIRFLKNNCLSAYAFLITCVMLGFVQWKVDRPMLMAERFIQGAGWIEILLISLYAGWITNKMLDPAQSAKWRRITWTIFTIVFFGQLAIGLAGYEIFLMTGKLHLPIPVMILAGPVFRGSVSIMPILFLSTILISGPAWCSHLCYFGALDNLAAKGKTELKPVRNKFRIKHILLLLIVMTTVLLRLFNVNTKLTTAIAIIFGILGIGIIIFISRRRGKMIHCIVWCPIGTLVNYMKLVSPFRMYIDDSCTNCMACTRYCNYDALGKSDIMNRKPGLTCTYCGDCLSSCKTNSIRYKFLSLSSLQARNTWIVLTISLHAITLALARI